MEKESTLRAGVHILQGIKRRSVLDNLKLRIQEAKLTKDPEERSEKINSINKGLKQFSRYYSGDDLFEKLKMSAVKLTSSTDTQKGIENRLKPTKNPESAGVKGDGIPIKSNNKLNHVDEFWNDLFRSFNVSPDGSNANLPGIRHSIYDKLEKDYPAVYKSMEDTFPNFKKNREEYKKIKDGREREKERKREKYEEIDKEKMERDTKRKLKTGDVKRKGDK